MTLRSPAVCAVAYAKLTLVCALCGFVEATWTNARAARAGCVSRSAARASRQAPSRSRKMPKRFEYASGSVRLYDDARTGLFIDRPPRRSAVFLTYCSAASRLEAHGSIVGPPLDSNAYRQFC